MNHLLESIRAKRISNLVSTVIILTFIGIVAVCEHSLLSLLDEYIATHTGPLSSVLRHTGPLLIEHPYVLILLVFFVVWLNSFVLHGPAAHDEASSASSSFEPPSFNVKQEANPRIDFKPEMKQEFNPQFNPNIYISVPQEQPKIRETIQETKAPEPIAEAPSHNIVFLGGERYSPDRHGLVGGGIGCENIRSVLAAFRNRHIVGSTVAHVYNVQAGITFSNDNGVEILYVSPSEWLRHNSDTVTLKSGGESEFVILAIYNYQDKRWETHKMVITRHYMGDFFHDEPRPLPFGTITADVALLEEDGTALEGGTVTFELKEKGEFEIH